MSEDLENTLRELGAEYVGVVAKLKSINELNSSGCVRRVILRRRFYCLSYVTSIAAMVVLALGLWMLLGVNERDNGIISDRKYNINPYSLAFQDSIDKAIIEIKRTQKPDGSWKSDILTRQNATVLMKVDKSSLAYRKAMRYLRSKGLSPLSEREFQSLKELSLLFVSKHS